MKTVIIIPARMASKRFPNKPMALIDGIPMIQRVWKQAIESNLGDTFVACSEKEVFELISNLGGNAIMTDPSLPSGTDRVYSALKQIQNYKSYESIINLQGDMPLIYPEKIIKINNLLIEGFDIGTLATNLTIKEEENVTEDLSLEPLTDYSKYKALCEEVLLHERESGFNVLILRPATVCGYSPRLRLDLTVNILTNHAVNNRKITVFGGQQRRPNIHIDDITDLYVRTLQWPDDAIDGKVFNVGYENHRVMEIAEIVRGVVGREVEISVTPTDDLRSYHISSERIKNELGFVPKFSIEKAVQDLVHAFRQGKIIDPLDNHLYYNIKTMQMLGLK